MRKQPKSQSPLVFKRWSRKSYAVFNSLSKVIRIGVLGLGCSILSLPAQGQQSGADRHLTDSVFFEHELDEVVVSAQQSPVLQSELMRVVQLITRSEIEQSPSQDLPGLLQSLSGVDVRSRGSYGMQSDISLRGGTFDQTMILINGVNTTDPQTGHHNLNIPVDIHSIERIEVLHGSGARIFGPNAFNGAINIITRKGDESHLLSSLTGGEYGFGAANISTGFSTGALSHHLSVGGAKSDGFTENTDFKNRNIYYRANLENAWGQWDAQAGYNHKAFGANSFYTPVYPNQFEETKTRFASLQWEEASQPNLKGSIYWRGHNDRFELFRDKEEAPQWYNGHNHHKSNVVGVNFNYALSSDFGLSTWGIDYRLEHILSNVLGTPLDKPVDVSSWSGAQYTHSYFRQGLSLMAEHSVYRQNFSASGGALLYFNSDLENAPGFFPGIDLAWQITPQLRWFASANRTLRLPTFTDLFYSGPTNMGNPNLVPEQAISVETGLKTIWNDISWELSLFRRWGTQMIDWVKNPGDELWQSMNHTKINISGLETFLTYPLYENKGSLFSKATLNLQYSFIHADKFSGDMVSNYAMDHLRHKFTTQLQFYFDDFAGLTIRSSWQKREGSYMIYRDNAFAQTQAFSPYLVIDARMFYRLLKFELFVEGSNLLDAHIVNVANVPQTGRWLRAGLKFSL